MSVDTNTWTPDLDRLMFSLDLRETCGCTFEAVVTQHYLDSPIKDAKVSLFMTTLSEDRAVSYTHLTLPTKRIV